MERETFQIFQQLVSSRASRERERASEGERVGEREGDGDEG
jgi:hypothetical protein